MYNLEKLRKKQARVKKEIKDFPTKENKKEFYKINKEINKLTGPPVPARPEQDKILKFFEDDKKKNFNIFPVDIFYDDLKNEIIKYLDFEEQYKAERDKELFKIEKILYLEIDKLILSKNIYYSNNEGLIYKINFKHPWTFKKNRGYSVMSKILYYFSEIGIFDEEYINYLTQEGKRNNKYLWGKIDDYIKRNVTN